MLNDSITDLAHAKRSEIVHAAAELFDQSSYHTTSMNEIAAASGLRKPTLYHYFRSKDEILFEIHEEIMDLLLARLAARVASDRSALDQLEGSVRDVLEVITTHRGHVRVFNELYRELPVEYRPAIAAKRDRWATQIETLIRRAREEGSIRDVDPRLARLSIFGMVSWAYVWFDPTGPMSYGDVADFMWAIFTRGLVATSD